MKQNPPSIKFTTLQEQQAERRQYSYDLSPLERLNHLHEMVKNAYGLTEEKPTLSKRIAFHQS